MDWSAEAIDRLRALWAEGLSTAEIGRRMGVSKNAVVGKAHRLNLTARPSPIRRDPSAPRPAPALPPRAPVVRAALPPRPAPAAPRLGGGPGVGAGAGPRPVAAPAAAAPAHPAAPPAQVAAAAVVRSFPFLGAARGAAGGARTCCWPIGEPGTAEFRFCVAEATPGKPYCAEHAAIAYVKTRDRREDAA